MMNFEKHRLESFRNWPIPWIDVKKLAQNGFYYTGYSDRVSCQYCNITLGNWEAEDNVKTEHKKWSMSCPIVKGLKTTNIPLDQQFPKEIFVHKNFAQFYDKMQDSLDQAWKLLYNVRLQAHPDNYLEGILKEFDNKYRIEFGQTGFIDRNNYSHNENCNSNCSCNKSNPICEPLYDKPLKRKCDLRCGCGYDEVDSSKSAEPI